MADPLKPTMTHSIDPHDPEGFPFLPDGQLTSQIRSLTMSSKAASGKLCSDFIDFLACLHALEVIVIHWQALDWLQLGEADLRAFVRLFSLPSLTELRVSASVNFPLCLLQHFTAKKLFISAITNLTSVMLLDATSRGREWLPQRFFSSWHAEYARNPNICWMAARKCPKVTTICQVCSMSYQLARP